MRLISLRKAQEPPKKNVQKSGRKLTKKNEMIFQRKSICQSVKVPSCCHVNSATQVQVHAVSILETSKKNSAPRLVI